MSIKEFAWWHKLQGFSEELDCGVVPKEDGLDYEINSYNFRCDEFTNIHKKKHVLFSGCSNTFGVGLLKEEVWANLVYNKINSTEELSGYFNIGYGGSNIINSILNIFKYCKKFGNPDVIFINLPDFKRFFEFKKDENVYRTTNNNVFYDNYYINKLTVYNYYFMLEQYCNSNNIKLFSFTCDYLVNPKYYNEDKTEKVDSTNNIFKEYNFKTFNYINKKNLDDTLFVLKQGHNNKLFDTARDPLPHRGYGIHIYWADFIYNKYLKKNKDDNSWTK